MQLNQLIPAENKQLDSLRQFYSLVSYPGNIG